MPAIIPVAMVLTAAGAGYSAYSQYQAGKSQQALNEYNATLADQQSGVARRDAAIQANQARQNNQRLMSKQRAILAANGVVGDTGSPLLVQVEQAGYLEQSALETERQGNMRASQYAQQAVLDRMAGKTARNAGNIGAVGTALGGLGSISMAAGNYYKGVE